MGDLLLDIKNLKTYFYTDDGVVPAVDGVDMHIDEGEIVGVVGESGCGKSVTAMSAMRLIPEPPGKIEQGEILFGGESILKKTRSQMRRLRGNDIAMIFQEPMTSLNPVHTCGRQVAEAIRIHQGLSKPEAMRQAVEMLRLVRIPAPEQRVKEYPHQLSGGMRQRIMIAMALSCNPKLLIADEPTTALDVTIQAQILKLMKRLREEIGMAIWFITHDLGVIAEMAERVIVMYAGKVVEEAPVRDLFRDPQHPYTQGLLQSIPRLDEEKELLSVIEGMVPTPARMPPGCRFSPRCPHVMDVCARQQPDLVKDGTRRIACWLYAGVGVGSATGGVG